MSELNYQLVDLLHRGTQWADEGSSLGPDRHARDIESLDRYAMERWEVILQFMVGSPSAVSQDLAQLLIQAGLMKRYGNILDPLPNININKIQNILLDRMLNLLINHLMFSLDGCLTCCLLHFGHLLETV